MNFEEAKKQLTKAKNKQSGNPYGKNTRIIQTETGFAIKLYNTNVVTFERDGTIKLDSGGYRTITTHNRINDAIREHKLSIYQENDIWYVTDGTRSTIFKDGMIITNGKIETKDDDATFKYYKKRVDKLVSVYIKGFLNHLDEVGLEDPSDGDCWSCLLKTVDMSEIVKTEPCIEPLGLDHYFSHFEEKYYVPSLLFNAIVQRGYSQTAWDMMKHDARTRRDIARTALQYFFRIRKLDLVKYLMKNDNFKG